VEKAVDGRLELGRLRWAAARCEGNPGGGELEAGLGRVEVLEKGWRSNRSKELGRGGGGSTNFSKRRTAASLVLGDREEEEGEM
jgi:hypothetical protein